MNRILLLKWITRKPTEGHFSQHFELLLEVTSSLNVEVMVMEMQRGENEAKIDQLVEYCSKNRIAHVHLDWMSDIEFVIEEFDQALARIGITWSSLGHLSPIFREASAAIENHWYIVKLRACTALKFVLVWDEFLSKKSECLDHILVAIPDYQDTSERDSTCIMCGVPRYKIQKKPIIGVVGQLYGYRGSERLIKKWKPFRAGFTPLLAGTYFRDSHSSNVQIKLRRYSKRKKIIFYPNFIPSNSLFNHIISHCDAIYIDTISYKVSSGVAQRALQMAVPVILENSDSCLNDRSLIMPGFIIWPKIRNLALEIQAAKTELQKFSFPNASKDIRQKIRDEFSKALGH